MKSRLVLSRGRSIGVGGVEPGVIRTANETAEFALVCGHDALVLSAMALGQVGLILKDAGESEGEFGQLVFAAAIIADFGTVILLSLLFSGNAGYVGSRLDLLSSF